MHQVALNASATLLGTDDMKHSRNVVLKPSLSHYMIGIFTQPPFHQPTRVYDYKSETEYYDRHVEVFKNCIQSAHNVSPTHGFAALKVTALGNPELLERMSTMIVEVHNLFSKFDEKGTGLISQEEFVRCYE